MKSRLTTDESQTGVYTFLCIIAVASTIVALTNIYLAFKA